MEACIRWAQKLTLFEFDEMSYDGNLAFCMETCIQGLLQLTLLWALLNELACMPILYIETCIQWVQHLKLLKSLNCMEKCMQWAQKLTFDFIVAK